MISVLRNRIDFGKEFKKRKLAVAGVFGCPGCGKGTASKAFKISLNGFVHVELREMSSDLKKNARLKELYCDKGLLVPDEETIPVFDGILTEFMETASPNSFLVPDGFGRSELQAKHLLGLGIPLRAFEYIASEAQAILQIKVRALLSENPRPEDLDPKIIARRLAIFRKETLPAIRLINRTIPNQFYRVARSDLYDKTAYTLRNFGLNGQYNEVMRALGDPSHPARLFIEQTKADRARIIREHNLLNQHEEHLV